MPERFIVWLSTTRAFAWLIKHVASRFDPVIFKATNGRLTSMGVPSIPMLTLTDSEKQEVWADVRRAIPQMSVYEARTDRNIRMFRLSRVGA